MKALIETFVIVKSHEMSNVGYFAGPVSGDRLDLQRFADIMNEKEIVKFEAEWAKRNKVPFPYKNTKVFTVIDLKTAIDNFEDAVADYHTEHDENY